MSSGAGVKVAGLDEVKEILNLLAEDGAAASYDLEAVEIRGIMTAGAGPKANAARISQSQRPNS